MNKFRKLPTRQRILSYIAHFWHTYNYPPTIAEIAWGIGLSSEAVVRYHLKLLRAEQVVEWQEGQARTIRLQDVAANTVPDAKKQG